MALVLFDFKQTLVNAKNSKVKARVAASIYKSCKNAPGTEEDFLAAALNKEDSRDFKTRVMGLLGTSEGEGAFDEAVADASGYELWPDTLQTLNELRELGHKCGVYYPTKVADHIKAVLKVLGVYDLFEVLITETSHNLTEAAEKLRAACSNFAKVFVVGDSLYREVAVANLAGLGSIWLNLEPASLHKNSEAKLSSDPKFKPTVSISGLLQLPGTLEYLATQVPSNQIRVGYYFPNKRRKLEVSQKKAFISNSRVLYDPILLSIPVEVQGEYDVIVQKVSDIYLDQSEDNLIALSNFQAYISRHPEVPIVDPLEGIEVFMSRERLASLLQEFRREGVNLRSPKQFTLDNIQFPATVKTKAACQIDNAHLISFVKSSSALDQAILQYRSEVVLQEYVVHSGQVYKISVLGDYIQLDVYRSPYFTASSPDLVTWDSSKPLPPVLKVDPVPNEISLEQVRELAETVKRVTGYSMMSFDLVLDLNSSEVVLVDINYFPSFRNIPDLALKFDDLFLNKVRGLQRSQRA